MSKSIIISCLVISLSTFSVFMQSGIKANSVNVISNYSWISSNIPDKFTTTFTQKTEGGMNVMQYNVVSVSSSSSSIDNTKYIYTETEKDKIVNFYGNSKFTGNAYYSNNSSSSSSSSSKESGVRIIKYPGQR